MADGVELEVSNRTSALLAKCDNAGAAPDELLSELRDVWALVNRTTNLGLYARDLEVLAAVTQKIVTYVQQLEFLKEGLVVSVDDVTKHLKLFLTEDVPDGDHYRDDEGRWSEEHFNMHNWMRLGALYYEKTSRPVPCDFLNGPLEQEKRRVERRARIVDDTGNQPQTRATHLRAQDIQEDEVNNTAKMVKRVYHIYEAKPEADRKHGVPFCRFFLDPDSFAQLVENLFYASFLIKDMRVRLFLENGEPMVKMINTNNNLNANDEDDDDDDDEEDEDEDEEEEEEPEPESNDDVTINHQILLLDYDTWQKLVEKYAITELYLGHRDDSEFA